MHKLQHSPAPLQALNVSKMCLKQEPPKAISLGQQQDSMNFSWSIALKNPYQQQSSVEITDDDERIFDRFQRRQFV
jgi:hypothetical protein